MDKLSKDHRSWNMSRIKGKNTKPEIVVRKYLHSLGFRFRLHRKDLPGKPDIVLPKHNKIIEVYGCYWHMHSCKEGKVVPKTNTEFWQYKRMQTVERDKDNRDRLKTMGWDVLILWECEIKKFQKAKDRIDSFLGVTHE